MRVLIVKTSSMGDVVHALPAVSDLCGALPQAQVDWLVEATFAAIPELHPQVRRVLPMSWRKWRKSLWRSESRHAIAALRAQLRSQPYDLVLDLQGLLKSALWARQADAPVAGYDRRSIREPLAAMLYARSYPVSRELHAVERCRRLAASAFAYAPPAGPPVFGIRAPAGSWQAAGPSAALIPGASRAEKLWPEERWIAVGRRLAQSGLRPVLLWGSVEELARARRIAQACGGEVPPFLSVGDTAAVLGAASQVVGLDTGFSHLAAAFGRPTIGIYCDHEPGLAGITGPGAVASLGGKGQVPSLDAVLAQLGRHLSK